MIADTDIVIIGAGPYGLSLAAHLRSSAMSFRIFGHPMRFWQENMPAGMFLKSEGFASNLYDLTGDFTLQHYCREAGIEYADEGLPVRLETFTAYGLAFKDRQVPHLEDKSVVAVHRLPGGFAILLADGETVRARRVILAVGVLPFQHVPEVLANLAPGFVSHSSQHHDLQGFSGRSVAVIGAGASAVDLAGLLHRAGAQVHLIGRPAALNFHGRYEARSLWKRIRHPRSGIGPGLRSRLYTDAPNLFHYLPENLRIEIVRRHLGPAAGWFAKDGVAGRFPISMGCALQSAQIRQDKVHVNLHRSDGIEAEVVADHVIAATGYRVDLRRLTFLGPEIRSQIKETQQTPVLSRHFESSVAGLYFVGPAAANSFGPVMRFAFGAGFAARHLTRSLHRALSRRKS